MLILSSSSLLDIDSALPKDAPTFLKHDQAFVFSYTVNDSQLNLQWDIAPGYYLYKSKIRVEGVEHKDLRYLVAAEKQHDEFFGETLIYKEKASASIDMNVINSETLTVSYRGCAEAGLCYPPVSVKISL